MYGCKYDTCNYNTYTSQDLVYSSKHLLTIKTLLYFNHSSLAELCSTSQDSLNKDSGPLEGRGGQHTSPGFLALSQSPIEDRTELGREPEKKRGLLWPFNRRSLE